MQFCQESTMVSKQNLDGRSVLNLSPVAYGK